MSDEPKKRSRSWIGWVLLAALVLYPLSLGPFAWLGVRDDSGRIIKAYRVIYWPFNWATPYSEPFRRAYHTYHWWWTRSVTDPRYRPHR